MTLQFDDVTVKTIYKLDRVERTAARHFSHCTKKGTKARGLGWQIYTDLYGIFQLRVYTGAELVLKVLLLSSSSSSSSSSLLLLLLTWWWWWWWLLLSLFAFFLCLCLNPAFFFITMRLEWTQILTEHVKSFLQFSQFFTRFLHQAKKKTMNT